MSGFPLRKLPLNKIFKNRGRLLPSLLLPLKFTSLILKFNFLILRLLLHLPWFQREIGMLQYHPTFLYFLWLLLPLLLNKGPKWLQMFLFLLIPSLLIPLNPSYGVVNGTLLALSPTKKLLQEIGPLPD
jgi:hypothetical protein